MVDPNDPSTYTLSDWRLKAGINEIRIQMRDNTIAALVKAWAEDTKHNPEKDVFCRNNQCFHCTTLKKLGLTPPPAEEKPHAL